MKLVLLPGMDGTGLLFEEFITNCQYECLIIPLPEDSKQSHMALASQIVNHLPDEDYVLLAESFSGALIPCLIQSASRQPEAVVLVASFLHAPRPLVISFLRQMPLKKLLGLPSVKSIVKFFCMKDASDEQFEKFWNVLKKLDFSLMKVRLREIQKMVNTEDKIVIPTLVIVAKHDKLIPRRISNKLPNLFSKLTLKTIDGPHFILQSKAEEVAQVIDNYIKTLV